MANDRWQQKHADYARQDWIMKPSIFAEQVIGYFPENASVLELGAGHGQDSIFFTQHGMHVTSTDVEIAALAKNMRDIDAPVAVELLDLNRPITYDGRSFDVVYAHLALHYFDHTTTQRIFDDIYRILKPSGIVALLVNSVDDPEYGTGEKLEEHLYDTDGTQKHFFDVPEMQAFASKFTCIIADNDGETYKDNAKGVHNLIRFIGKKD